MYDNYLKYIESFVDDVDISRWQFKSNPNYCVILEPVDVTTGYKYLNEIQKMFNFIYNEHKEYLIEICKTNDLYGNTNKHDFTNFTICSPSNLRYILHSMLILKYMQDLMLNNIDIIEIGGGYGGLCFFIYKIAPLFNITINTYSIFDLKLPLKLQKKYLDSLNVFNVNYVELDNIKNLKKNSFLISNYAFSEISLDLQQKYTDMVLNNYVSHGFLTWNFINMYEFISNKKITVEYEYPLTDKNNKYVRFRPLTLNNC